MGRVGSGGGQTEEYSWRYLSVLYRGFFADIAKGFGVGKEISN